MKVKAKKELHTKTVEELKSLVNQAREELSNLRLEKVRKKLKNTSSILQKRKNMAVILTILKEKETIK